MIGYFCSAKLNSMAGLNLLLHLLLGQGIPRHQLRVQPHWDVASAHRELGAELSFQQDFSAELISIFRQIGFH